MLRAALLVLVVTASTAVVSCGGDDCAGLISINAPPAECEELAERFGCPTFEVDGPTCGLLGCARCDPDDTDEE